MVRPGEAVYYYHNDHLGTPRVLTNSTGNVVWKALYAPFGKVTITTATVENNLRFPGQYYDTETGLHYNWNRYYDPKTGRYITPDPIGLEGGINLYPYVENNPLNYMDPFGLATCIYSISTGTMYCMSDYGNGSFSGQFASGNNSIPGCKNNSSCSDIEGVGPIPAGGWVWGTKGSRADRRNLEPLPFTDMHKRPGPFQTHHCSQPFGPSKDPPYCSSGCVTSTPSTIRKLNRLIDNEPRSILWVIK